MIVVRRNALRVGSVNLLYSSSMADDSSDKDSIDHRRLISSKPCTDSRRDDPTGIVCRVLECLSSLSLRALLGTRGTAGLVDASGDQSLYESEKDSEVVELRLFSVQISGAKRTCL